MQSPPIEWAAALGYLGFVDWLRDRGEPDGDTATEVLRNIFRVEHPQGRLALAAAISGGGVLLYRHLVKPEMRHTTQ